MLLVCENLHWIDTETQAFLESLVDSLPTVRLLLLVNYRPKYHHPWGSRPRTSSCGSTRCRPPAGRTLAGAAGGRPQPRTTHTAADGAHGGNPFFLEESVRTLVETGLLGGEPGAYRLEQPLHRLHVPATVQAVLAARIDRLPPARSVCSRPRR